MPKTTKKSQQIDPVLNKALNLLSYRPRSAREISIRLLRYAKKRKIAAAEKVVRLVLDKLRAQKDIDDLEFAKWWIGQRLEFKPRGKRLLRQELRQKGVTEKIIEQALNYYWQEERDIFGVKREAVDELTLAKKVAQKKAKSYYRIAHGEFKQKMIRYLISKGFDYDISKEVIEKIKHGRQK